MYGYLPKNYIKQTGRNNLNKLNKSLEIDNKEVKMYRPLDKEFKMTSIEDA